MSLRIALEIKEGPQQGRKFTFAEVDRFLVGRAREAHLRLPDDDPCVSRNHCLIEICPPNALLHDLQSTNGTYVNGEVISEAQLKSGDVIRMGTTVLTVRVTKTPGATEVQPRRQAREEATNRRPQRSGSCFQAVFDPCCIECQKPAEDIRVPQNWSQCPYLCLPCAQAISGRNGGEPRGQYLVLEELGQGGMGVVYKAWHRSHHRLVALKMLTQSTAFDKRAKRLFRREISVLRDLAHPNIVRLIDEGTEAGESYLVSEYMDGGD